MQNYIIKTSFVIPEGTKVWANKIGINFVIFILILVEIVRNLMIYTIFLNKKNQQKFLRTTITKKIIICGDAILHRPIILLDFLMYYFSKIKKKLLLLYSLLLRIFMATPGIWCTISMKQA